jgi:predicted ATPase
MKIQELRVSGFRSLKDIVWRPGDINVVIGPNGTGKSNLLRILELVSTSAVGNLSKYIQHAGGMEPLLWDGRADAISFRLKTAAIEELQFRNELTYDLIFERLGSGSAYRVDSELLADFYKVDKGFRAEPSKYIERHGDFARMFDEAQNHLTAAGETISEDETLLSLLKGPFTANATITYFQKQVAAWSVYHDLHVNQDAVIRQPAVARRETTVHPDGQNLIPVLHTLYTTDRDFKNAINEAMRAAFGNDFEELVFPPASDQRIQLRVRWKTLRREQSAADLSDGTLRFLFLLTCLASPTPAPIIAIDEPETGLHPSMLPIIAEYAVNASSNAQIIFTTHSDQFLDAFQDTKPTTTVARWADGETTLKTLDGSALDYWLKEYSLGALFRSGELEAMA